jgi:hypothetical protein
MSLLVRLTKEKVIQFDYLAVSQIEITMCVVIPSKSIVSDLGAAQLLLDSHICSDFESDNCIRDMCRSLYASFHIFSLAMNRLR